MPAEPGTRRLPRALHPGAWWAWSIGLATAASRTTNPVVLALILAVVAFVVTSRRSDAPWARGLHVYVLAALVVVGIRIVFRMLLGSQQGGHVLFTLPELPLPSAAAGVRIGGPVSAEGIVAAAYDGMRLATLLVCIGAANLLANPKRLLKALPGALHEVGVAVRVALTFAPQIVESGHRIARARRLRGGSTRRRHVIRTIVIPVLTDALDRSLALAAAMDSRGYGRTAGVAGRARAAAGGLMLTGLVGACVGTYGLLDSTVPRLLGLPLLGAGVVAALGGLALAGRRIRRTRYRPDPWRIEEWLVVVCGTAAALAVVVLGSISPADANPSVVPLTWPRLPLAAVAGILVAALPAWLTPPVERAAVAVPGAATDAGTAAG
jgi:energy-coupling factor transport system permease protein